MKSNWWGQNIGHTHTLQVHHSSHICFCITLFDTKKTYKYCDRYLFIYIGFLQSIDRDNFLNKVNFILIHLKLNNNILFHCMIF